MWFFGLLHLEIIQERLSREFDLNITTTAPSVIYNVHKYDGNILKIHNPADIPETTNIDFIEEPWIIATIFVPDTYLGSIIELCINKRGEQKDLSYSGNRTILMYELPLQEIVFDFYDSLKSISSGYASFDWEMSEYRKSDVVKMNIMINSENADALSCIVHRSCAEKRGREVCKNLQELIPRHQFAIPIQATLGGKIIARETVKPYRKDVTAKLYGGDRTRRMKLLEKQKKGKKRMSAIGNVNLPQNIFTEVLKLRKE